MRVKSFSVTFSRTVSPKDFNPVRISLTEDVELDEDDDRLAARRKVFRGLKKAVDELCEAELDEYRTHVAQQDKKKRRGD